MFETLFTCSAALRRHKEGPMAAERVKYLTGLIARCLARPTILTRARYCLRVAVELQKWPPDHRFEKDDVAKMVSQHYDDGQNSKGWSNNTKKSFRFAAIDFLRSLGHLIPSPAAVRLPQQYEAVLSEFIALQHEERCLSEATCYAARRQITIFLEYIQRRGIVLQDVEAVDVDGFYAHMSLRWGRNSLRASAKHIRAWFRYCERRNYTRLGLASTILLPRIYSDEGLPLGPTWDTVGRMLANTSGDDPLSIRNHAIILLLSVYGLRSSEVQNLCLDDIDWARDRIRIIRAKSQRCEEVPLETRTGNAIVRYLRHGRPQTPIRNVFVGHRPPFGPISKSNLYHIVSSNFPENERPEKGRGPHGLRHACARFLLESGKSFKEVGDHLGHSSPDSTKIYAKVNLRMLRRVAFDDLGGLI